MGGRRWRAIDAATGFLVPRNRRKKQRQQSCSHASYFLIVGSVDDTKQTSFRQFSDKDKVKQAHTRSIDS